MPNTNTQPAANIPLKDRTAQEVREVFKDFEPEVSAAFLRLHAYAQAEALGISKLAKRTGISDSALSQAYNGKYPGNIGNVAEEVDKFFYRLDQKALYGGLREFVKTDLSQVLWKVFEKTRIIRRIQPVQSPEQVGKTRCAQEYTDLNNHGRTVFFSFSQSIETLNDFIHSFGVALGLSKGSKLRDKKLDIPEKLVATDLIILDEAHGIFKARVPEQRKILEFIRTDLFQNGQRGIVLLATDDRETGQFMDGVKLLARSYHYNVGQLLGRMHNEVMFIDPAEDITEQDVLALVSRYYKPGRAALAKLHDLSTRPQLGHFGLLDNILTESWGKVKGKKDRITDEVVTTVADRMLANMSTRKALYE